MKIPIMKNPRFLKLRCHLLTLFCALFPVLLVPCTGAANYKLPDSGQTTCYQLVDPYDEIPCDGTGQDGEYSINPMSFKDNGNGTVTDNNTGLMWQKEDDNQKYNWYEASGTYDATYNNTSLDVCGSLNLGEHTDWRLPTKTELIGLVDYGVPSPEPVIQTLFFPNTELSGYWTATNVPSYPNIAWAVFFNEGSSLYKNASDAYYVRCVRGGQKSQVLVDNGDDTVTDGRTGLVWQKDGQDSIQTWDYAIAHCKQLPLGGYSDWRLPNVRELESLVDAAKSSPAIDTDFFPNTPNSYYWSSSTYVSYPQTAWSVDFGYGKVIRGIKGSHYNVRCVRGGVGGSLAILSLAISGNGSGTISGTGVRSGDNISFSTTTTTTELLDLDSTVKLVAIPDTNKIFTGWSEACGGTSDCSLVMDANKQVTATFIDGDAFKVKVNGSYYSKIMDAYKAASADQSILAWDSEFSETFIFNEDKAVNLAGGYNTDYSSNNGYTILNGVVTIVSGSLTVENLVIK
jgi:hypothetical protein